MSEPLTPADCDLRDFAFMPLDVVRLRDSTLAIKATGEEFRAAVLLWCASWHQVPAGSLPDDDAELATFAGFGRVVKEFKKIKAGAIHGWVKCSDGRLYHPVIAEKVRDAWEGKRRQQWRTECARVRKHNERHGTSHRSPDFDEWVSLGCPTGQPLPVTRDIDEMSQGQGQGVERETPSKGQGQGEGQGQGQGQGLVNPKGTPPPENPAPPPQPELLPAVADAPAPRQDPGGETHLQAACRETWGAYAQTYADRYGTAPVRNQKINSLVKQFVQRIGAEESHLVAAWFVQHPGSYYVGRMHDFGCLLTDAEKLRTEWATGRVMTAGKARQSDRAGTTMAALAEVLAEQGEAP